MGLLLKQQRKSQTQLGCTHDPNSFNYRPPTLLCCYHNLFLQMSIPRSDASARQSDEIVSDLRRQLGRVFLSPSVFPRYARIRI
jgi:hypothetical protein